MSVRIEVQMDHQSESMRYLATATLLGKRLHQVGQFGGPEARDKVVRKMAEWLQAQGYPVPDHYWQQQFSPQEQCLQQLFPEKQWRQQKFPK